MLPNNQRFLRAIQLYISAYDRVLDQDGALSDLALDGEIGVVGGG